MADFRRSTDETSVYRMNGKFRPVLVSFDRVVMKCWGFEKVSGLFSNGYKRHLTGILCAPELTQSEFRDVLDRFKLK